jgi:hypothetical protein
MSKNAIQLVIQAAENGNRRDVPGNWTPKSTLSEVMETMQSEIQGVSLENATLRYLQKTVPQEIWFKTTLDDLGLRNGGRALLILRLGTPGTIVSSVKDPPKNDPLETAIQNLLNNNFDVDTKACIKTLLKIIDNVLQQPDNQDVRSIRMANPAFRDKVIDRKGGGKKTGLFQIYCKCLLLARSTHFSSYQKVEVLIACGFRLTEKPPPLLSQIDTGVECLVLAQENEDIQHLVKARRLLVTKAIQDLGMSSDDLPKFKNSPRLTEARDHALGRGPTGVASSSGEFDPYRGHRFDAKSAAVGKNLGPDGDYVSPTEQQLQALQTQQKQLESSMHRPLVDRGIVASLPSNTPSAVTMTSNVAPTVVGPSDGTLLANQFKKREEERRQREEGGFTTKAMRDLEKLKRQKVYSHAQLRVHFADGSSLEIKFLPKETIKVVHAVIKDCLLCPEKLDFDLFVAPPRRKLKQDSTLEEEGLVPAAKVFLSWKPNFAPDKQAPVGTFLKPDLFREGTAPSYPSAASLVESQQATTMAATSSDNSVVPSASDREETMLRRMMGQGRALAKSSNKDNKGGKPKWFK